MTTKPTITIKSLEGEETLTIWPPIPDVTDNPVIQIDRPRKTSIVVELSPADLRRVARAAHAAARKAEEGQ